MPDIFDQISPDTPSKKGKGKGDIFEEIAPTLPPGVTSPMAAGMMQNAAAVSAMKQEHPELFVSAPQPAFVTRARSRARNAASIAALRQSIAHPEIEPGLGERALTYLKESLVGLLPPDLQPNAPGSAMIPSTMTGGLMEVALGKRGAEEMKTSPSVLAELNRIVYGLPTTENLALIGAAGGFGAARPLLTPLIGAGFTASQVPGVVEAIQQDQPSVAAVRAAFAALGLIPGIGGPIGRRMEARAALEGLKSRPYMADLLGEPPEGLVYPGNYAIQRERLGGLPPGQTLPINPELSGQVATAEAQSRGVPAPVVGPQQIGMEEAAAAPMEPVSGTVVPPPVQQSPAVMSSLLPPEVEAVLNKQYPGMIDEDAAISLGLELKRLRAQKKRTAADNARITELESLAVQHNAAVAAKRTDANAAYDAWVAAGRPKEGVKANALQEPGAGGVLQRPPEGTGSAGGQRGGVEPGQQGLEPAGAGSTQAPAVPPPQASTVLPVENARPSPVGVRGAGGVIYTPQNTPVPIQYALVDARDLIASHNDALTAENPAYDQSLQPRERGRQASLEQVASIQAGLTPERLLDAPSTAEGAPLIGPDGQVESGNGRAIALRRVYASEPAKAQAYRDTLRANAERFGLDPAAVDSMQQPVLVRVRQSEMTPSERAAFVREAGASPIMAMGAGEVARNDAARLLQRGLLLPDSAGRYPTPTSREFQQRFLSTLEPSERAAMIQSDGALSLEGQRRLRNAVAAAVLEDPTALERMLESPEDATRNIGLAIMDAAPQLAVLKQRVAAGERFPLDISAELAEAANTIANLRERGMRVDDWLANERLFDEVSPVSEEFIRIFENNKRSSNRIAAYLSAYADAADRMGNPQEGDLFDSKIIPQPMEVLMAAQREVEEVPDVENVFTESAQAGAQPSVATSAPLGSPESGRSDLSVRPPPEAAGSAGAAGTAIAAPARAAREFVASALERAAPALNLSPSWLGGELDKWEIIRREPATEGGYDRLLLRSRANPNIWTYVDSGGSSLGATTQSVATRKFNQSVRMGERGTSAEFVKPSASTPTGGKLSTEETAALNDARRLLMHKLGKAFAGVPLDRELIEAAATILRLEAKKLAISVREAASRRIAAMPQRAEVFRAALKEIEARPLASLGVGEQIANVGRLAAGKPIPPPQGIKLPSTKAGRALLNKISIGGRETEHLIPEAAGTLPAVENARRGLFADWFERHHLKPAFAGMSEVERKEFMLYGLLDRLYADQAAGSDVRAGIANISDIAAKELGRSSPITPRQVADWMDAHRDVIAKYREAQSVNDALRVQAGGKEHAGLFGGYYVPALPTEGAGIGITGGGALIKPVLRLPKLAGQKSFTGEAEAYSTDPIEAMRQKFTNNAVVANTVKFWQAAFDRRVAIAETDAGKLPAGISETTQRLPDGTTRTVHTMRVVGADGKAQEVTARRFDLARMGYSNEYLDAIGLPRAAWLPESVLREITPVFDTHYSPGAPGLAGRLTQIFLSTPTEAIVHARTLGASVGSSVPATTGVGVLDAALYALRGTGVKTALHFVQMFRKNAYDAPTRAAAERLALEYGVARPEIKPQKGIKSGVKIGGKLIYGERGMHDNAIAAIYQFGKEQGWSDQAIGAQMRNLGTQSEFLRSEAEKFVKRTFGVGTFYQTNATSIRRGLKYGTPALAATLMYQSLVSKEADKRLHGGEGRWFWQIPGRQPWQVPVAVGEGDKDVVLSLRLDRDTATAERWIGNLASRLSAGASAETAVWSVAADTINYLAQPATTGPQMGLASVGLGRSGYLAPSTDRYGVEPMSPPSASFPLLSKERGMAALSAILPTSVFATGEERPGQSSDANIKRLSDLLSLVGVQVREQSPNLARRMTLLNERKKERRTQRIRAQQQR